MARRGILTFMDEPDPAAPKGGPAEAPPEASRRAPDRTGRGAVGTAVNDLLSNSQREIDVDLIDDDDGPRDRLSIDEDSIKELRESIRAHGQMVPLLVRQNHERPGRFKIVYGRRRLAALRPLGVPAKVLIRNLTDREAVVAQGLENSSRQDPSFIEKALFAKQLRERNYDSAVIQDALAIDQSVVSRMKLVADTVPLALVGAIGAAPGVGRRRWEELARALEGIGSDEALGICFPEPAPEGSGSDERFDLALSNLAAHIARASCPSRTAPPKPATPIDLRLNDGRAIARLKSSRSSVSIEVSRKEHPEYAAWLENEAETILAQSYARWREENGS